MPRVLLLLLVLLIASIPVWPYNAGWGYRPASALAVILLVLLLLWWLGLIAAAAL